MSPLVRLPSVASAFPSVYSVHAQGCWLIGFGVGLKRALEGLHCLIEKSRGFIPTSAPSLIQKHVAESVFDSRPVLGLIGLV